MYSWYWKRNAKAEIMYRKEGGVTYVTQHERTFESSQ